MVWALDYQPAPTSAAALPPVTLTEEEAGFNLHHEAGGGRGGRLCFQHKHVGKHVSRSRIYLLLKRIFQPHLDLMGTTGTSKARGIRTARSKVVLAFLRNASQVNRPWVNQGSAIGTSQPLPGCRGGG